MLVARLKCAVSLKGGQERSYQLPLVSKGSGGWRPTRVWLARIGSSRVDASLGTLRCLLSVALSARWQFSPIIISCDGRYSLPYPLIRFSQAYPTYRLSDPSRLQRTAPSVPLNGQSNPLSLRDTRPILQTNRRPLSAHKPT